MLAVAALLGCCLTTACGDDAAALRQSIHDVEPVGNWIYDDIAGGLEAATKANKPLMLVFRCVP